MDKILHIDVVNKIATYRRRDGDIVCGNSDYVVEFTFDSDWDDSPVKTARFITPSGNQDVVFEGTTVAVPKLYNARMVSVGVFAGDLHTTTAAVIGCLPSILCQGGVPADPAPDVYAQIMALLNKGVAAIDLSRLNPDDTGKGYIVETYADGSTQETELTYTDGKITKIKDSDGNETVLTW